METSDDLSVLLALADESEGPPAKRVRPGSSNVGVDGKRIDLSLDPCAGIRICPETRRLSIDDVRALAATFALHRLDAVPRLLTLPTPPPPAWITFGVLVDKSTTKRSQGGGSFSVWKMSDLKKGGTATTISLFLFGDACSLAWKELPGSVFAILSAKKVPRKEGSQQGMSDIALSIEKQQQLQRIGQASEFAFCKAERKDGRPCTMWVNKDECAYCEFHINAGLRASSRGSAGSDSKQMSARMAQATQGLPAQATQGLPARAMQGVTVQSTRLPRESSQENHLAGTLHSVNPHYRTGSSDIAAALAEEGYTFQPPDPNAVQPFKFQFAHRPPQQQQQLATSDCTPSVHRPASKTASAIAPTPHACRSHGNPSIGQRVVKSSFAEAFGHIDPNSLEAERLRQARATASVSERDSSRAALDRRLTVLAKKDALITKVHTCPNGPSERSCSHPCPCCFSCQAQNVKSIQITAYKCHQCGYLSERVRSECRAQGHQINAMTMTKRFFSCRSCNEHIGVLNKRLPTDACVKCGKSVWKEAGMRRFSAATTPSQEFLPRGEEVGKFRGSESSASKCARAIGVDNASSQHNSRCTHNDWQASIPIWDDQCS